MTLKDCTAHCCVVLIVVQGQHIVGGVVQCHGAEFLCHSVWKMGDGKSLRDLDHVLDERLLHDQGYVHDRRQGVCGL